METKLARISQLSKENPQMVFTSIGHFIDEELLRACHEKMDGNKAVGIDGVTKEEYEKNLEENLRKLVERLKRKEYKPQPARRVEIPKDNGKMRPLSIYCYEDKLVQEALREILEAVFEPHFYEEMVGFRPNRNCHEALKKLDRMIGGQPTNYVLDADIRSFFNHLDHEWIVKFIGSRIKDPNIIRLVSRMLKAGIIEDYAFEETTEGSGQGSVCSPIIANIYMHYVLVWWFHEVMKPRMKEYCGIIVYADDFVVCFKSKEDTQVFSEVIDKLNIILIGYYHYYGINGNRKSVMNFRQEIQKSLFYWTNRRSQRKSYTWRGFNEMLKVYPLAMPKTYVVI